MKVLSVIGISKSGKTTSVERIIAELKRRGYSVASVKDIHFEEFAIDEIGTNTYRHAQAGADPVVARGCKETDFLYQHKMNMHEILAKINADWLIIEGERSLNVPRLLAASNTEQADAQINPTVFGLCGVISNDMEEYKSLPVYNALTNIVDLVDFIESKVGDILPNVDNECCQQCGLDCERFLVACLNGDRQWTECTLRESGAVSLRVNGTKIPMVPFVERILANAVLGVVRELKGVEEGQEIDVTIHPE